ncbi:Inner membrane protein CreD [Emticicia aquatica]|uniref:Inner membrane protein CreD n=1 Tax=Emticicia aquatica TaxID=1681835 RepID=A0ABM9AQZ3_9BACT|nr:cell envelope integrity protein CreD [Emticicia aquatica]CAH0995891.1 Inner membrane protein CreD [Emticicia aquatica]
MEDNQQKPTFLERNAALIKGFFIGFLILLLLIPTLMIDSLINERESRKTEAIQEVSSKWGNKQQFIGPILRIPYYEISKVEKSNTQGKKEIEQTKTLAYAYFLPDKLSISGKLMPEKRNRGIFDIVVYRSKLNFNGDFSNIQFDKFNVLPENIVWKDATILLTISDSRGIEEDVSLNWNGNKSTFNSGGKLLTGENEKNEISGIITPVLIENEGKNKNSFSFDISLKGSEAIDFIPVGKITEVSLQSNWQNPSFIGAFLPDKRNISEQGFSASWKVLHLNRDFPQQWIGIAPLSFQNASFGVKLITPNDNYQKSNRSSKYAILIISLTFLAFFFIEIINRKKVHPFNYILIGLALCIFYTLLVSISEVLSFNLAYFLATIMTLGLIFLYSKSIFSDNRSAIIISAVMLTLYSFVFVIIQLEDTALLIGSIGLFIILAITMYVSRKIDWENVGFKH